MNKAILYRNSRSKCRSKWEKAVEVGNGELENRWVALRLGPS